MSGVVAKRIVALAAVLCLTGCPYTEGCDGLVGASPQDKTAAPEEDGGDDGAPYTEFYPDGAPVEDGGGGGGGGGAGPATTIDFGPDPVGGPVLSTLSCPDLAMPKAAGTVYVDANAAGAEVGTKAAPFRTVEKAFASAAPSAIVWIAAGLYKENLVIPNKDLVVFGGFASGFGSRTNGCATILEAANTAQPVLSAGSTVKTFALEGVTVRKGVRGIDVTGDETVQASFTIARCVFSENGLTSAVGGGAALAEVNARIFRSVFKDNKASKGAAVSHGGKVTLTVDQNLFEHNLGYSDHGGGLYLNMKSAKISRNTFRGNRTGVANRDGWGGAAIVYNNSPFEPAKAEFSFNVFTENVAGIGGAVFVDDGATVSMSHDLLYRNRAYPENEVLRGAALYVDGTGLGPAGGSTFTGEYLTVVNNNTDDVGAAAPTTIGGNIYVEGFSKATFTSSIFWNNGNPGDNGFFVADKNEISVNNSIAVSACTSEDAVGFIPANATICKIGANVFLPAGAISFVDEATNDYHEKSTAGHFTLGGWVLDGVSSPAIDKGDPTATVGSEPAPNGGRANLGAFARTIEASKTP